MKRRQITIKDIAKALHISSSTVFRSLADHPDISQETKNIVNACAREHKYKPNALTLSLRTNNTETTGVVLPQIVHYFFSSVLSDIKDEAEKGGCRVIICQSNENYGKEVRSAQVLLKTRVYGVLASVAKTTTIYNHFQELIDGDIPMVSSDHICTGILTDRVIVDDYTGVCSAVECLIRNGCRRIAFFGFPSHSAISNNRRMGYKDALCKDGLSVDKELIKICDNYTEVLRLTPELLSLPNRSDTLFAVNDGTATGILNVVKAKGLRIPGKVPVCGFTNSSLAEVSNPLLTSVDQHGYGLGATAMRLLIGRSDGMRDGDHIVSKIIKTNLVVR